MGGGAYGAPPYPLNVRTFLPKSLWRSSDWKDNSNPGIVCIYKQIELLHSTGVPKLTPEYGIATTTKCR